MFRAVTEVSETCVREVPFAEGVTTLRPTGFRGSDGLEQVELSRGLAALPRAGSDRRSSRRRCQSLRLGCARRERSLAW
jgi:hypothetical protein